MSTEADDFDFDDTASVDSVNIEKADELFLQHTLDRNQQEAIGQCTDNYTFWFLLLILLLFMSFMVSMVVRKVRARRRRNMLRLYAYID